MKVHAVILLIAAFATLPLYIWADDSTNQNSSTSFNFQTLNERIRQFNPHYVPEYDSEFNELLRHPLENLKDTDAKEAIKTFRLAMEHYEKLLQLHTSELGKNQIHTLMSKIITRVLPYFYFQPEVVDEVQKKYFDNIDLMLAKATQNEVPASHKGYSPNTTADYTREKERLNNVNLELSIKEEYNYRNFVSLLQSHGEKSIEWLLSTYRDLKHQYQSTEYRDINVKLHALNNIESFIERSIRYGSETNNAFIRRFFEKENSFVATEYTAAQNTIKEKMMRDERIQLSRRLLEYKNEIFNFVERVLRTNVSNASARIAYLDNEIELSVREIHLVTSGNVASFTQKEKVFTYKVLGAARDAQEVSRITAETLLSNPYIHALYFEDPLRIPTGLRPYRSTNLGSLILVKPNLCARLFN